MFKHVIASFVIVLASLSGSFAHAAEMPSATDTGATVAEALQVNINDADAELLADLISGVGQARAQAIIDYRKAHGPFRSIEEIAEVKGIGNAILERNRDRLRLR